MAFLKLNFFDEIFQKLSKSRKIKNKDGLL